MHSCIEVIRRKHKHCGFRRLNPRPSLCQRHGSVLPSSESCRVQDFTGVSSHSIYVNFNWKVTYNTVKPENIHTLLYFMFQIDTLGFFNPL